MNSLDLNDTDKLIKTVQHRLHLAAKHKGYIAETIDDPRQISSVLFLLGHRYKRKGRTPSSPCVIMNLRSHRVRQPGDVCCPGGGLSLRTDNIIARFLRLPHSSLDSWPFWSWWRKHHPAKAEHLTLFYAAALREGFEEMRLNPFGVTYLGPLPPQHLVMFKRVIYPHVAWIRSQRHFIPNWEVERIVYLPIVELLNPSNYARYRLQMSFSGAMPQSEHNLREFLCYTHHNGKGTDILWGATFRITMDFLYMVFGFKPPKPATLPVVEGRIDDDYIKSG